MVNLPEARSLNEPLLPRTLSELPSHSLAGQSLRRRGSEVDRHPQRHHSHVQGTGQIWSRLFDTRIPKRLFYGELSQGRQQIGRPKKSLQILSQILPQRLLHQHGVVLDVSCRPPILAHNHIHAGSSEDSRGKKRTEAAEQTRRQTRRVGAIVSNSTYSPYPSSAPPEGEAFSPGLALPCSHLRTHRSNPTHK